MSTSNSSVTIESSAENVNAIVVADSHASDAKNFRTLPFVSSSHDAVFTVSLSDIFDFRKSMSKQNLRSTEFVDFVLKLSSPS